MKKNHNLLKKILIGIFGLILLFLFSCFSIQLYFTNKARKYDISQVEKISERSEIFDKNGTRIYRFHGENRDYVELSGVSKDFIKCLLEREDSRFYGHNGVDYIGVVRAVFANLKTKSYSQGASTITQQLVKNTFELREKSIPRKLLESAISRRIEANYTKNQILEFYINEVFFGRNIYGIKRAANVYFGKDPSSLNLAEGALLAGIICAPNYYDPVKNLEGAKLQQQEVLNSLNKSNRIYEEDYNNALNFELVINSNFDFQHENYALDNVREKVEDFVENIGSDYKESGGLKVYTSIDNSFQESLQDQASKYVEELKKTYKYDDLQIAIIVLDNESGGVLAMIGGKNFENSRYNRTLFSERSIGSTIKPFIFTKFLEKGNSAYDRVSDSRLTINTPGKPWSPSNFGNKYEGNLQAFNMLLKSKNVMAVRMIQNIGFSEFSEMNKQLGLNDNVKYWGESLAIQSSPINLAQAYLCLANKGLFKNAWIIDKIIENDKTIYTRPKIKNPKQLFESSIVDQTLNVMRDNSVSGTGARLQDSSIASKTGTSNDSRDCLIATIDDKITCISWILRDSNKSIGSATSSIAVPVAKFVHESYRNKNTLKEEKPTFNPNIQIERPKIKTREATKDDYVKQRGKNIFLPLPDHEYITIEKR